jgi:hypothetical protein
LALSLVNLAAQFLIERSVYPLVGRYLFPFISAFAITGLWGWQAWWPARWKAPGLLVAAGLLMALDFVALGLTIVPYFYS